MLTDPPSPYSKPTGLAVLAPVPDAIAAAARPRSPAVEITPMGVTTAGQAPSAHQPDHGIRRVRTGSPRVGGVPAPVSAAAPGASAADLTLPEEPLPSFLGGPNADQVKASQDLAQLRQAFGVTLQTLRGNLRNVGELLDGIATNKEAEIVAKREGMDLRRIKTLHAELMAKADGKTDGK